MSISESEQEIINSISKKIDMNTLIIFWQFILKGIDELSVVFNPTLSLEMIVIRLIHLKDMPSYESVLDSINTSRDNLDDPRKGKESLPTMKKSANDDGLKKIPKNQIKNIVQTKPELSSLSSEKITKDIKMENINSFEDLIKLSSIKKEIELKHDLERNVNLVKFIEGKIDISFNENLGKNFVRNLSERLLEWTGKRWVITLTKKTGQKTFFEQKNLKKKELTDKEKKGKLYEKFKNIFSDGELIDVTEKD